MLALAADLFTDSIQPVLTRDCAGCHGQGQAISQLDVRTREGLLKGGSRGPALVPGKASESLLFQFLTHGGAQQMPPGKRLPPETIAAFAAWIDDGAPWQAAKPTLWSLQPIRKLPLNLPDGGAPADRRTLIRRLSLDLTGLPPKPDAVQAFLDDQSPDAYAKLVDRLLNSNARAERLARHWLDVVRYADTSGYSNDFERPNAWRYRDYVIRSFRSNKPYNRFVQEQLAGDELFPGDPEALIATGFLRMGPWEHTAMSVEAVTRQMYLDDVTAAVGTTFLGLTTGCARCHDHKFDPIPTKDYYRLQAVFATTEFARPQLPFLGIKNTSHHSVAAAQIESLRKRTRHLLESLGDPKRPGFPPEDYEALKVHQKHMELYAESLDRVAPKAFAVSSGPRDGEIDGGRTLKYPKRSEYTPPAVKILIGGNLEAAGDTVTPGVLSVLGDYPIPASISSRRAALARWITDPANPLTPRVIVNRIWQWHFGEALAANTNNFGVMGAKPSNPDLLDALTHDFIESGYDVKALQRKIVLSRLYQSASRKPRRLEAEAIRDSMLAAAGVLNRERGGPGVFPEINEEVARQPQHRMGTLAPPYFPSPEKAQRYRRSIYSFQQRSLIDPLIDVFNGPSPDLTCERREESTVPTQAFALFNSNFAHTAALEFALRLQRERFTPDSQIERAFELAFNRLPTRQEMKLSLRHFEQLRALYENSPAQARPTRSPIVHAITSELTGETFRFTQLEPEVEYELGPHPSDLTPHGRALAGIALSLLNANEFLYVY